MPESSSKRGDFPYGFALQSEMAQKIGLRFRGDFFIHQLFYGQTNVFIGQMVAGGELTNEFFEHVE